MLAVNLMHSAVAQAESRVLKLSDNNNLSPAHARPLVTPTQDMVIGAYYLTELVKGAKGEGRVFKHMHELDRAFEERTLDLHAEIEYRGPVSGVEGALNAAVGRPVLHDVLP